MTALARCAPPPPHTSGGAAGGPQGMQETHSALQERNGNDWTLEDSAASLLQRQFRRLAAMKRVACVRRLKARHEKLTALNSKSDRASAWSKSDSMANLLQAAFRAKLAKRAVEKATKFVVRSRMQFWHSDLIIEKLRKTPQDRTDEDLEVLHKSFVNIELVHNMESKLVQLQCCRYLRVRTIRCGATVFKQGDVGDVLYIVLDGCVEYEIDGGKAVLHSGIGDYFGEQSLRGENGGRRDATVTAKEDTLVATLERADYLRLSNELTGEVLSVLKVSVARRKPIMLRLVQSLFQDTPFFRKIHFSVLQRYCCGLMQLQTLLPGEQLFKQGDHGEEFFTIIEGTVDVFIADNDASEPKLVRTLDAGDSFGELALVSDDPEQRRRTATIVAAASCDTPILLAKLSRDAYLDATKRLERKVFKVLAIDCDKRTDKEIETLFEFFRDEDFFDSLRLDGMRRQCCSTMVLQRVAAGEILYEQDDVAETFHVVVRGVVRVIVNGNTVRELSAGASFGEIGLLGQTEDACRRTATIMATEDTLLAALTKADFLRVQDQKELQDWINKFWVLLTTTITEVGITAEVEWEAYRRLHVRIRKTIAPDFNRKESRAAAKEDWQQDLNRHNKGGHTMNHEQFSNALFELIDVWCEGATSMLMYIEFLRMVFLNVTLLGRKKGHLQPKHVLKKVEDVSCLTTNLDNMRTSLTERFHLEEEKAERERQLLAQKANIGVISSELYVESSNGNLWVNTKALVKSALKLGLFQQGEEPHAGHNSGSSHNPGSSPTRSSFSSSSDSDDEELVNMNSSDQSQFDLQPARGASRRARSPLSNVDSPLFGDVSGLDTDLGADVATSLSPSLDQQHRQLTQKVDDIQQKLSAGVLTSSTQMASALVELRKFGGPDLPWTGMEQERMQLLSQLETMYAMKHAAETGSCYIPPNEPETSQTYGRGQRAGKRSNTYGRGHSNVANRGLRLKATGLQTWRDKDWGPGQVWVRSLLSQAPVDICRAPSRAPPPDPRHVPQSSALRSRRQHLQSSSPFGKSYQTTSMTRSSTINQTGRRPLRSERRQAVRSSFSHMPIEDSSVIVRRKALQSQRWFELETKPEGSRRRSTRPLPSVPTVPTHDLLTRPSTALDMASTHLDSIRSMSSYSNACLQVSRGSSHPMLGETPWHRPASADNRRELAPQDLTLSAERFDGVRNDPLGVEPLIFTRPLDKWFGRRAMLSPGRRGRPRAVPT